jgi:hypothetical protein
MGMDIATEPDTDTDIDMDTDTDTDTCKDPSLGQL